jgi:predicted ArsR family transcriptional regulator
MMMLLPAFKDLIKPQWRKVLEQLKLQGPLPVTILSKTLDASYMAVKQQCEDLKKIGYLGRTRVPRSDIGRPEIFYALTPKANALFPDAGIAFTLDLLRELKHLFGENSADKLLFQYFEKQRGIWQKRLGGDLSRLEIVTKLAALRAKEGCFGQCVHDPGVAIRIEEYHHPLQQIFEHYPRAIAMEQRMLEQLIGTRIHRRVSPSSGSSPAMTIFEISLSDLP